MQKSNYSVPILDTEEALIRKMTTPSAAVKQAISELAGEIMILGAGGKMGPSLAELLINADARVIGVDLFPDERVENYLASKAVQTIRTDLMEETALNELPETEYIILMAGTKFGSFGNEPFTWAINAMLPGRVMHRFRSSKIIYVSSGNVYKYTPVDSGGATEEYPVDPIGEYAQSRLGGERLVQFFSARNGTPACIVRLFYASELRYGIIHDVAQKIKSGQPIDLSMGYVNQIWQGDANAALARLFPLCESPAKTINLTGLETLSVRDIALRIGEIMGRQPTFIGEEQPTALLGNAGEMERILGAPQISIDELIEWVTWWVEHDKSSLGKPTKYESRTGKF
ncbi:NAD(P)-dependent oxidoreductase [candidate division KSB1 bacterium]|nr:NAD(P)-dependent oxidoreductase [candidate division KSB1 bacterium]